ncbi:MAG: apolipoprotein N-acyltransferase [Cyanobacteria bacterium P01_C01_bin.89]
MFQGEFRNIPQRSPWLICVLGGILGGLALEPVGWFPLAGVALVPVLWTLGRGFSYRTVAIASFAWGFGFHGVGLWWLTGLHPLTWLGLDWWTSVGVALGCWLLVSLWGALLVTAWGVATAAFWRWLGSPPHQQSQPARALTAWGRIFWATTLWCVMETLGNWTPLWWTALGLTQSPHNLPLLHWGQVSGPITIAAILVLINGCIAEAFTVDARAKSGARSGTQAWVVGAIALVLVAEVTGLFAYSHPLGDSPDDAIDVGIIQGNMPNELKFGSNGWLLAVQGYSNGYQALADQGVDLVIFPETAIPLIWQEPFRSRSNLYKSIRDRQTPALLGVFEPAQSQPSTNGRRSFVPDLNNSLLAVDGNVQPVGRYSKRYLVPLGEYIPFQEILGQFIQRLSPLQITILPGKANQLLETPLGQSIAGICYDSAFAENFRYQAAAGGQWIVTSSNNAHYRTAMFAQHHAQDVMRAIETDRWLASATNTGTSAITNPHGIDQWHSIANTYAAHADTIYRRTTQTLYVRWGNWLVLPLAALSAVLSALNLGRAIDE